MMNSILQNMLGLSQEQVSQFVLLQQSLSKLSKEDQTRILTNLVNEINLALKGDKVDEDESKIEE